MEQIQQPNFHPIALDVTEIASVQNPFSKDQRDLF